jgi:hypothetical protein
VGTHDILGVTVMKKIDADSVGVFAVFQALAAALAVVVAIAGHRTEALFVFLGPVIVLISGFTLFFIYNTTYDACERYNKRHTGEDNG